MNRAILPFCISAALLVGCGNGGVAEPETDAQDIAVTAPKVAFEPGETNTMTTTKLQGPVRINYRIIGEPIVGQPVAVDLQIESSLGTSTLDLSYRVNDSTALSFPETQTESVAISPSLGDGVLGLAAQQVNVIPLREGRLFLNVAISIDTDTGSWSSVTAVPIQVGQAPRELLENGTVTTDENGELIRSLPAKEN